MDQSDLQYLAMVLLEMHLNLGRAIRENTRLNGELAKLQPKPPQPEAVSEPPKEG